MCKYKGKFLHLLLKSLRDSISQVAIEMSWFKFENVKFLSPQRSFAIPTLRC